MKGERATENSDSTTTEPDSKPARYKVARKAVFERSNNTIVHDQPGLS